MTNWIESLWGRQLLGLAAVTVEGREHIEKARAAKTGIILARLHQKFDRGISASPMRAWLAQQTFRPLAAVGDRRHIQIDAPEQISNAQDMVEAFHVLRRGGVVQIAADGPRGNQKISVDFLGRQMDFRTGFAELALVTHAQVLPIHFHFRTDGTMVITISPPLRMPEGVAKDLQVVELVNQYAAVVSQYWIAHPHMIFYHYMKKHMEAPKTVSRS